MDKPVIAVFSCSDAVSGVCDHPMPDVVPQRVLVCGVRSAPAIELDNCRDIVLACMKMSLPLRSTKTGKDQDIGPGMIKGTFQPEIDRNRAVFAKRDFCTGQDRLSKFAGQDRPRALWFMMVGADDVKLAIRIAGTRKTSQHAIGRLPIGRNDIRDQNNLHARSPFSVYLDDKTIISYLEFQCFVRWLSGRQQLQPSRG